MTSPPPQSSQPQQPVDPAPAQAPGQTPPAVMTMRKPGTVTGIQVILWIFVALGGVGDIAALANMARFAGPITVLVLIYSVYTTVQSLITPIHIERGRRWAWVWTLVNVIIGAAMSLVAVVLGALTIEYSALPLVVGLVLVGLQGTLLGLLCSPSARQWILMHRIQRGEVRVADTPGQGLPPGSPMPRPEVKPGVVTATQVGLWILFGLGAVEACYLIVWFALDQQYFPSLAESWGYTWTFYVPNTVLTVLLLLLSWITVVGIGRGRNGARLLGLVWVPVLLLTMAWWAEFQAAHSGYGIHRPYSGLLFELLAYLMRAPVMVWVFVMLLLRGVRLWTGAKVRAPREVAVVLTRQAGFMPTQAPPATPRDSEPPRQPGPPPS